MAKIYLTYPVLDETFRFYVKNNRFPKFYDLLTENNEFIFCNELFLFSISKTKEIGLAAIEFYKKYILPTRQTLNSIQPGEWLCPITLEENPLQSGFRFFKSTIYQHYPKSFRDLCVQQGCDPFIYTTEFLAKTQDFFIYRKHFSSEKMCYLFDAMLMFKLNFDFIALSNKNSEKKVINGFKQLYLDSHLETEEEKIKPEVMTPAEFIFKNRNQFPEFSNEPYHPLLYLKYDIPSITEKDKRSTFDFGVDNTNIEYELPDQKTKYPLSIDSKFEMSYFYPMIDLINHIQYDRSNHQSKDRYLIQKQNESKPIVFIITPDIYVAFLEYISLDKNRIPPIVHLLCKNNYLKFAVFSEMLRIQVSDELHLMFAENLHPIYLNPFEESKEPPSKKSKKWEYMKWALDEATARFKHLYDNDSNDFFPCGIITGNEIFKKKNMKHLDGSINENVRTLQRALRYLFDVFHFQYDPVRYDLSTFAFNKKPRALPDSILYMYVDDFDPLIKSIQSKHEFRKSFDIKSVYRPGYLSIYTDSIKSFQLLRANGDNFIDEYPRILSTMKKNFEERSKHRQDLKTLDEMEQEKEDQGENQEKNTNRDYVAEEYAEFKQRLDNYEEDRRKLIALPLVDRIVQILSTSSDEYPEILDYMDRIEQNLEIYNPPVLIFSSFPYVIAYSIAESILYQILRFKEDPNLKKHFLNLCKNEGFSTAGFDHLYSIHSPEIKKLNFRTNADTNFKSLIDAEIRGLLDKNLMNLNRSINVQRFQPSENSSEIIEPFKSSKKDKKRKTKLKPNSKEMSISIILTQAIIILVSLALIYFCLERLRIAPYITLTSISPSIFTSGESVIIFVGSLGIIFSLGLAFFYKLAGYKLRFP